MALDSPTASRDQTGPPASPQAPAAPTRLRHLLLLLVGLLLVLPCEVLPGQDGLLAAQLPLQPPALAGGQLLLPVLCLHLLLPLEELREVPGPIHKLIHPGEKGEEEGLGLPPGQGLCWPLGSHRFPWGQ